MILYFKCILLLIITVIWNLYVSNFVTHVMLKCASDCCFILRVWCSYAVWLWDLKQWPQKSASYDRLKADCTNKNGKPFLLNLELTLWHTSLHQLKLLICIFHLVFMLHAHSLFSWFSLYLFNCMISIMSWWMCNATY